MLGNIPSRNDFSEFEFHNYAPWINVVLGFFVFVLRYWSPRGTLDVRWNLFLTGIVVMFAALAAIIAHDGHLRRNYWSIINIAAGVWLFVSVVVVPSVLRVTISEEVLAALIILVALISLAIELIRPKPRTGS